MGPPHPDQSPKTWVIAGGGRSVFGNRMPRCTVRGPLRSPKRRWTARHLLFFHRTSGGGFRALPVDPELHLGVEEAPPALLARTADPRSVAPAGR